MMIGLTGFVDRVIAAHPNHFRPASPNAGTVTGGA
jgi:hypothetical protein